MIVKYTNLKQAITPAPLVGIDRILADIQLAIAKIRSENLLSINRAGNNALTNMINSLIEQLNKVLEISPGLAEDAAVQDLRSRLADLHRTAVELDTMRDKVDAIRSLPVAVNNVNILNSMLTPRELELSIRPFVPEIERPDIVSVTAREWRRNLESRRRRALKGALADFLQFIGYDWLFCDEDVNLSSQKFTARLDTPLLEFNPNVVIPVTYTLDGVDISTQVKLTHLPFGPFVQNDFLKSILFTKQFTDMVTVPLAKKLGLSRRFTFQVATEIVLRQIDILFEHSDAVKRGVEQLRRTIGALANVWNDAKNNPHQREVWDMQNELKRVLNILDMAISPFIVIASAPPPDAKRMAQIMLEIHDFIQDKVNKLEQKIARLDIAVLVADLFLMAIGAGNIAKIIDTVIAIVKVAIIQLTVARIQRRTARALETGLIKAIDDPAAADERELLAAAETNLKEEVAFQQELASANIDLEDRTTYERFLS
jgi:hypothetical protein